jgi:ribosomal-protein-alanine N-acetyltransferase
MRLIGEKVYLEPAVKEDLKLLKKFCTHPKIRGWWYGKKKRVTLDFLKKDWKGYFSGASYKISGRSFRIKKDGVVVGFVNYNKIEDGFKCEIDIILGHPDYLGKGYGTDALKVFIQYLFSKLSIVRVWVTPWIENKRAIKAYRRAGFRKEGVLKKADHTDGEYRDLVLMAAINPDFQ